MDGMCTIQKEKIAACDFEGEFEDELKWKGLG